MFPNVRLLIAAVVASVVALSCGFAMFATFRVNHEPLSRLAAGAAPLQLAAGNPTPFAATPPDSFGVRFPANQTEPAGAPAAAAPPQPDREDSAPSATASGDATVPETAAAAPEQPVPEQATVAPAPEPTQSDAAAAPNESPPVTSTDTAAAAPPPVEQATPTEPAAPAEQVVQEPNPDAKPDTTATVATSPAEAEPQAATEPAAEPHHKAGHRHRVAAKAPRPRQPRLAVLPGGQPAAIGGPFVPPPSRVAAKPSRVRHARAVVQPVSQPSGIGGPFVPPMGH